MRGLPMVGYRVHIPELIVQVNPALLLSHSGKYKRKKENIILLINKNEAIWLRSNGYSNYVKSSHTDHKKYYVVESSYVLRQLREYQTSNIVK